MIGVAETAETERSARTKHGKSLEMHNSEYLMPSAQHGFYRAQTPSMPTTVQNSCCGCVVLLEVYSRKKVVILDACLKAECQRYQQPAGFVGLVASSHDRWVCPEFSSPKINDRTSFSQLATIKPL